MNPVSEFLLKTYSHYISGDRIHELKKINSFHFAHENMSVNGDPIDVLVKVGEDPNKALYELKQKWEREEVDEFYRRLRDDHDDMIDLDFDQNLDLIIKHSSKRKARAALREAKKVFKPAHDGWLTSSDDIKLRQVKQFNETLKKLR